MTSSYKILEPGHLCPIAFLLATYGSRGDKLLFKYPTSKQKPLFTKSNKHTSNEKADKSEPSQVENSITNNKFSYQSFDEIIMRSLSSQDSMIDSIDRLKTTSYVENNKLSSELKEEVLVSLLAILNNFSTERFFLKLEDIIFIGNSCGSSKFSTGTIDDSQTIRTFNVVFVLKSTAPKAVQDSYYNLAKAIASAICLEEKRVLFLNKERFIIQNLSDELQEYSDDGYDPLKLLLERSQLCRDLKKIVDDVCQTGIVISKINNMATVCQCIPQRIYNIVDNVYVCSSDIVSAANKIKPYHTLIFLMNKDDVIKYSPVFNPDLKRFINCLSIKDTIFTASIKSGLQLNFCLKLSAVLVLWNKAIIVYPVQDSNIYCIAPFINVNMDSKFLESFHDSFPSLFLPKVLLQINISYSYSEIVRSLSIDEEIGAQLFEWLLMNRMIYQVHKYFILSPYGRRDSVEFSKLDNFPVPKSKSIDEETGNLLTQLMTNYPILFSDDDCNIDSSYDADLYRLFLKIIPLCDGEHHLDEIYFQINERRSEIMKCLEQFSNFIVTIETSDPVTSCFVGIV